MWFCLNEGILNLVIFVSAATLIRQREALLGPTCLALAPPKCWAWWPLGKYGCKCLKRSEWFGMAHFKKAFVPKT